MNILWIILSNLERNESDEWIYAKNLVSLIKLTIFNKFRDKLVTVLSIIGRIKNKAMVNLPCFISTQPSKYLFKVYRILINFFVFFLNINWAFSSHANNFFVFDWVIGKYNSWKFTIPRDIEATRRDHMGWQWDQAFS